MGTRVPEKFVFRVDFALRAGVSKSFQARKLVDKIVLRLIVSCGNVIFLESTIIGVFCGSFKLDTLLREDYRFRFYRVGL